MKSNKSKKKNQENKKLRAVLITLGAIIAASILGYIGYNSYLDATDKQRFETVRASVEKLQDRLQKAASSGEEWKVSSSCSQGSVKFQEPKKACSIKASTETKLDNDTQAKNLIGKYNLIFKQASDLFTFRKDYPASPSAFPNNLVSGIDTASYTEKETGMICSGSFEIGSRGNESSETSKKQVMEIRFSCNSGARQLHYPRNDL